MFTFTISVCLTITGFLTVANAQAFSGITAQPNEKTATGGTATITTTYPSNGQFSFSLNSVVFKVITVSSSGTVVDGVNMPSTFSSTLDATGTFSSSTGVSTLIITVSEASDTDSNSVFGFLRNGAPTALYTLQIGGCPTSNGINSSVTTSSGTGCTASIFNIFGCNTTFSCTEGFAGDDVTSVCQNDATWSNDITCTAVTCDANSLTLKHNNTVIDGTTQATYQYNETATVKCKDNYIPDSTTLYSTIYCRCYKSNTWDCENKAFECVEKVTTTPTTVTHTTATDASTAKGDEGGTTPTSLIVTGITTKKVPGTEMTTNAEGGGCDQICIIIIVVVLILVFVLIAILIIACCCCEEKIKNCCSPYCKDLMECCCCPCCKDLKECCCCPCCEVLKKKCCPCCEG